MSIPKPDDPFTSLPITLNHDLEAFFPGWISDNIFKGFERTYILPSYITVYRKRKSIDNLTLNYIMFLEDAKTSPTILARHLVLVSRNCLTVSKRKHRSWSCINMYASVMDMLSGLRKQIITQSPFSQPTMHILRYPTYVELNKDPYLHVSFPMWLPSSNHKRSSHHQI